MSTNYYLRFNICEKCKRYDRLHIGKAALGWQFHFQGYNDDVAKIKSYKHWIKWIHNGKIFDEYGVEISLQHFIKIVKTHRNYSKNYAEWSTKQYNTNHIFENKVWKDKEGYVFSMAEFS
jgi:hypothetical protein